MRAAILGLTLILAWTLPARAQMINTLRFTENGQALTLQAGKDTEVGIDSVLGMRWDHPALFGLLATRTGRAGASPFVQEITLLQTAIRATVEAQDALIAFKVRLAEERAATIANSARVAAIGVVRQQASDTYLAKGEAMIAALKTLEAHNPTLMDVIDQAILGGPDYDPLVQALTTQLRRVQDDVAALIARGGRVQVLMTATLIDSAGRATALHLPGYDTISTGPPTPFARFNLALDQRAMNELEAAEAFAPIAADIKSGKFTTEVKKALDDLPRTFQELKATLSGVANKEIDGAIAELRAAGTEEARAVAGAFDELKSALSGIDSNMATPAAGATETLAQTATRLFAAVSNVRTVLVGLPQRLQSLTARAEPILKARGNATATNLIGTLKTAADTFLKQHGQLLETAANLEAAYRSLSLVDAMTNQTEAISRTAQTVDTSVNFDTALDFTTARVERHPGDRVHVSIEVNEVAPDGSVRFIEADRRTFRLEQLGWYAQTRGALLFVEPLSDITRDISFHPTPAVGFQFRYGASKKPFWNHGLAPSIGVSLALLDFDDGRDFELGIALNVTLLQDLLWVGRGRDVQVKANYWYFGVNPLALSGLFRQ